MKIAIIAEVFLPKIDGVVGRTVNLIRQLQRHGDEVVVYCPEVGEPRNSPVPVIDFPSFPFPQYPEYLIGQPDRRLIIELRKMQPDVIHFINPFAFGYQCYDLLQKSDLSIPTVFSFHTLYGEFVKKYRALRPLSPVLWWLTREYHNAADLNLTVSEPMLVDLERRGFRNVKLWQPAVDTHVFAPERATADMRARLFGVHPNKRLLLTVSRLAPEKNVEFLAEILQRIPDTTLAIVGDGPQRAELERRFAGLPASFAGYLTGTDLAEAYASADAFVYSSETETMGNVILEAMSCGLPVVAARAGGVPSLFTDGKEGFLFTPGDAGQAEESLRWLLSHDSRRRVFGALARVAMLERTWERSADLVRSEYQRLTVQGERSAAGPVRRGRPAKAMSSALVGLFRLAARLQRTLRRFPVGLPAETVTSRL